jgi:hypothetical protein
VRDVAGELAGAVHGDDAWGVAGRLEDLHLARPDHEELEIAIADIEELLARGDPPRRRAGAARDRRHPRVVELRVGDGMQVVLGHSDLPRARAAQPITLRARRP